MKQTTTSMVRTVRGNDVVNKLEFILLLDNTIKQRIYLMSKNILKQLIH